MTGWRKSTRSNSGACVEAGNGPGVIGVRDSAAEASPVLEFPAAAWTAFTAALKARKRPEVLPGFTGVR